jgi:hypothetical protein
MVQKKRDAYAFGDDPVIEDGGNVRVPIFTCDSLAGYRAGWVAPLTDAQVAERQAALDERQRMVDRAVEAWRNPIDTRRRKPDPDEDDDDDDKPNDCGSGNKVSTDARAAARASYDAMCDRLQQAWRTPNRFTQGKSHDAAEPDNSSPPDVMRRHLRESDPDPEDAQRQWACCSTINGRSGGILCGMPSMRFWRSRSSTTIFRTAGTSRHRL